MPKETKIPSTALALNTQQTVDQIIKEVQDEFITSDREVYKAGLRSLMIQEQKLNQQKAQIDNEITQLREASNALTEAFKSGTLHSVSDARGVVRKVNKKLENNFASDLNDFDDTSF